MSFKSLKFSLIFLLFFMNVSSAYQTDSRGFRITSSPGSSFGMPSTNTPFGAPSSNASFGAPLISGPPVSNQSIPQSHQQYYYFDNNGYPYFVNTTAADNSSSYVESTNEVSNSSSSLPSGKWISAKNGEIPDKAIVYQINNDVSTYYCRASYKYTTYYGVLTPEGCFVHDQSETIRLNQYEVLVSWY